MLIIVGKETEQDSKMLSILDCLQQYSINYLDIEISIGDQLNNFEKQIFKSRRYQTQNIVYQVQTSQKSFISKMISSFKMSLMSYYNLILLAENNSETSEANFIKKQLDYKFHQIQISSFVKHFQNYQFENDKNDKNKQVALFISNKTQISSHIIQSIYQIDTFREKWYFPLTPEFNMESEQKDNLIFNFQTIFAQYQKQISTLFFVIEFQRTDLIKKIFNGLYAYLRQFKNKIIVLIVNCENQEIDCKDEEIIKKYLVQVAKIKSAYFIQTNQLQDHGQLALLFQNILKQEENVTDVGINLKDTIFELEDEAQKIENEYEGKMDNINYQIQCYQQEFNQISNDMEEKQKQIKVSEELIRRHSEIIKNLNSQVAENQLKLKQAKNNLNKMQNEKLILGNSKNKQKPEITQQNLKNEQKQFNQSNKNQEFESNNFSEIEKLKNRNQYLQTQLDIILDDSESNLSQNKKSYKNYQKQMNSKTNSNQIETENFLQEIQSNNKMIQQLQILENQSNNFQYQFSDNKKENRGSKNQQSQITSQVYQCAPSYC